MAKILIDPGHGGADPGAQGNGIREKALNLDVCLELAPMLKSRNVEAILTRAGDVSLTLAARTDMAVKLKVDAVLSDHHNAGGGKGIETYRSLFNSKSTQLANVVHAELLKAFPEMANRGVKTRLYPNRNDWDYYHMIRLPTLAGIPSIITETGFVDNPGDAAIMKRADFAKRQAEALAKGICGFFGVPWDLSLTPIVGAPQATVAQAQAWAKSKGAHQRFIDIAPTYWKYGQQTGIRPEVLYAQSAHETAYGKYGGAVTPDQNNWAGIKVKNPVGDRREDHQTFATPDDGVRGHFNHMGIYVGIDPIGEPHPRWYATSTVSWAGTIRYVEELGGKWAPRSGYGQSIVSLINSLLATDPPQDPPEPLTLEQRVERLEKAVFG